MRLRLKIFIFLIMALGLACTETSTGPEDPFERFIASVSLGSDTLITDMTKPLVIYFHLDMDRKSVEEALSTVPAFEYDIHWTTFPVCNENDSTCYPEFYVFYVYPHEPLLPNTTYHCAIDSSAHDITGDHLPRPYEFEFTTESTRLLQIIPEYDGVDTACEFPRAIKLRFNYPIDLAAAQQPFTAAPSFDYEFYGTSAHKHIFDYRITAPLQTETEYLIKVNAQLFDIQGNMVNTEIDTSFTTGRIRIIYHYPNPDIVLKDTYPIIQVRFNTVMDKESARKAFSFNDGVLEVPGDLVWLTDKALQFFPAFQLTKGETYTFAVSTSARDTFGTALSESFSYSFTL